MKKRRVTITKADHAPEAEGLEGFDVFANGMANALMRATESCLNGVAALNGEIAGFVADRWRRDVDLGQSMARCENWNEAVALQQEWAEHTVRDYLAEASKLMQVASRSYLSPATSHSQPIRAVGHEEKPTEGTLKAM